MKEKRQNKLIKKKKELLCKGSFLYYRDSSDNLYSIKASLTLHTKYRKEKTYTK